MDDRIKKLEIKITELENKLKQAGTNVANPSTIDPEEFKTYQKISAQLGQQIACYICRPHFCWPCWPCLCPCGPGYCRQCSPCIASGKGSGGASFSSFM